MFQRNLEPAFRAALADTPVVLVVGARQVGKSTLIRQVIEAGYPATYLTLDDLTTLNAARSDPSGFIGGLDGPVAIDEIQRVPDLLLAIKAAVDRERTPGRFILTGSANVMALPRVSDTLVGRIQVLRLRTLSQGEIGGTTEGFVDRSFEPTPLFTFEPTSRADLADRIVDGGYPEALGRTPVRRRAWFDAYLTTILQRDVRDVSRIDDLTSLPRLLSLLAARSAGLLNTSEVSRSLGMPLTTVQRHVALLEAIMLFEPIPAWSANLGRRLARAPKVTLTDTGLAASLRGVSAERLVAEPDQLGPLLESLVATELRRQLSWSATGATLFHYRDHSGGEVDLILEDRAGRVVAIEVKSAASVGAADTRSLRHLADALGNRFVRGIVLYTGDQVVPFAPRVLAVPVWALWSA